MGSRARFIFLAVSAVLVLVAHLVHDAIPEAPAAAESLDAPDPVVYAIFTMGHEIMAADLAWLEAVQYYGDSDNARYWYARLAGILDAVVALDPDFAYAYLFGGLALTSTLSGVDAADKLLLSGMERFRDDWRFPFYIGINAFLFRDDLVRAADFFTKASQLPDSPSYLATLAARMLSSAGECNKSLALVAQLRRREQDTMMQRHLEERYRHTVWECNFQVLEDAAARFRQRHGSPPAGLEALVAEGLLPGVPQDPYGGAWGIDREGRVTSTTKKKRLRVHIAHREGE